MDLREFLFDNLVGDLEYHPKRGLLYICIGIASGGIWFFVPSARQFATVRLAFCIGGAALVLKGVFLLRRSSEGLALPQLDLVQAVQLSPPPNRKALPSIPSLAAQILQDFGAGLLLAGPFLHVLGGVDESWGDTPSLRILLAGLTLFVIGWFVRRSTSARPVIG